MTLEFPDSFGPLDRFSFKAEKEIQMNHFQRYLIEEFAEDYTEGSLSRREALKLIAGVTGSVLLASSILAACIPPESSQTALLATSTQPASKTGTTPSSSPSTRSGDRLTRRSTAHLRRGPNRSGIAIPHNQPLRLRHSESGRPGCPGRRNPHPCRRRRADRLSGAAGINRRPKAGHPGLPREPRPDRPH